MLRLPSARVSEVARATICSQRKCATATQVQDTQVKSYNEIPGPKGIYNFPMIGFAFHLKPFTKYTKYTIHELLVSLNKKYGPIFKLQVGGNENVFVCDADDIERVLKMEETNPYRPPFYMVEVYCKREGQPKGLGVLNGDEWGSLRRPAQYNMLRPLTVQRYFPLMSEVSDNFVDHLSKRQFVPNVRKELMAFAIENVAYLAFNRRIGCIESDGKGLIEVVEKYFSTFGKSIFAPPFYKYYRNKLYRDFAEHSNKLYSYVDGEIEKACKELSEAQEKGDFDPENDPHLLHQLLSDKRMDSPEKVKAIIIDLFNAGGETTASTMTMLLKNLASNKGVQDKLYQEICKEMPADGVLTEAALKRMSYVKACLKESFRLHFPVPAGTQRVIEEDIVIKDYLLPKGTFVLLCMNTVLTKNPKLFPDPDAFIPERWIRGSDKRVKNSYALLPFGFGARSCLGQRFAEQEIYICLIKLIQKFEVSLPDPGKVYKIIYRPFVDTTEPVALNFTPR